MSDQKVACITGSTSGLGKMTALLLGEQNWKVVLNSRSYGNKINRSDFYT
jgi:NADP-dependent 3-hydroxy acid dehydrogenase YdfG